MHPRLHPGGRPCAIIFAKTMKRHSTRWTRKTVVYTNNTHITRGGLAGDLPNVNDTLDMVMRRFGRGSSDLASRSNEEAESPS